MNTKMKTKSALSYFGSDSEVAGELASLLNHCSHVTIPFVGGASIVPYLKARAIVANDLNANAINFYRVVSGIYGETPRQELISRCQNTLSHPDELDLAKAFLLRTDGYHTSRAWAYWTVCWLSRKGKGGCKGDSGLPSVRWSANGGTNATRIQAAAHDLEAWASHFKRCEWESRDFREILSKVKDEPANGIYCDPPWVDAGDSYLHSFTEQDHYDLRESLNRLKSATVVVRYGDDEFIRSLYRYWHIIEASSRDQCNAVKGELWITNKAVSA